MTPHLFVLLVLLAVWLAHPVGWLAILAIIAYLNTLSS